MGGIYNQNFLWDIKISWEPGSLVPRDYPTLIATLPGAPESFLGHTRVVKSLNLHPIPPHFFTKLSFFWTISSINFTLWLAHLPLHVTHTWLLSTNSWNLDILSLIIALVFLTWVVSNVSVLSTLIWVSTPWCCLREKLAGSYLSVLSSWIWLSLLGVLFSCFLSSLSVFTTYLLMVLTFPLLDGVVVFVFFLLGVFLIYLLSWYWPFRGGQGFAAFGCKF